LLVVVSSVTKTCLTPPGTWLVVTQDLCLARIMDRLPSAA